ncbi:hypothetical protein [Litoribacillus peritrichatus]|uniref:Lipoprotein n=1 Tax=Litoribacillus peritrichatus TaxID=718191 RepID=A0ABP7ND07_9GAMM
MNKLFFVTLMGCTSSLALAFGVPGVDLKVGNDVQNAMTALQVLQDGGVKCNEITSMKPHGSGTKVQCDGKKYYILIKNSKGEYVMKTN